LLALLFVFAYYSYQLWGERCIVAFAIMLARVTDSKGYKYGVLGVWLAIEPWTGPPARTLVAFVRKSYAMIISSALPGVFVELPTTCHHGKNIGHQSPGSDTALSTFTPHSNSTLQKWISEDALTDSSKRAALKAKHRLEAETKDRQTLLLWRLRCADALSDSLNSEPTTPSITSSLSESWRTDTSPLLKPFATNELRLSLRRFQAQGTLTCPTTPFLRRISPKSKESELRVLDSQLPPLVREWTATTTCSIGRLDNGSYLLQVQDLVTFHVDLQRKTFTAWDGDLAREIGEKLGLERAWRNLEDCGTVR
jgi:hypothetical protein